MALENLMILVAAIVVLLLIAGSFLLSRRVKRKNRGQIDPRIRPRITAGPGTFWKELNDVSGRESNPPDHNGGPEDPAP